MIHSNKHNPIPLLLPCLFFFFPSRPDVFKGLFNRASWGDHPLPMIHCHCFALKDETEKELLHRAQLSLGGHIDNPVVHIVRDVSPRKHMYCISFRLPEAIAFAGDGRASLRVASSERAESDKPESLEAAPSEEKDVT